MNYENPLCTGAEDALGRGLFQSLNGGHDGFQILVLRGKAESAAQTLPGGQNVLVGLIVGTALPGHVLHAGKLVLRREISENRTVKLLKWCHSGSS